MKEKDIQNSIIEYLNMKGCWVWRNNAGKIKKEYKGKTRMIHLGMRGLPDIIGIRKKDGKFIGLEVKVPKRKKHVTPLQEQSLQMIRDYGGIAGVATSIEEADKILNS